MMADFALQLAAAQLANTLMPDDEIAQAKASAAVVARDGTVQTAALRSSLPWYRADVSIHGNAQNGNGIKRIPFPQGATIRHVSVAAGTSPTSIFSFRIKSDTDEQSFGLQPGLSTMMRGTGVAVPAGSWLSIDVLNDGGAADIDVTVHYSPGAGGTP